MLAVLPVGGQHARNPGHISCVENELGLREFLEERNCEYVVTAGVAAVPIDSRCAFVEHESSPIGTLFLCRRRNKYSISVHHKQLRACSTKRWLPRHVASHRSCSKCTSACAALRVRCTAADKDGEQSEMARNLPDADIIISTPFHPAYVTRGLIEKVRVRMLFPTLSVLSIVWGVAMKACCIQAHKCQGEALVICLRSCSLWRYLAMCLHALMRTLRASWLCRAGACRTQHVCDSAA